MFCGVIWGDHDDHDDHDRHFPRIIYMRASRKFYFDKLRTSAVQHLHEDLVALNPVVAVVPVANTEGLCRDTPTEKERKKGSLLERFTGKRKGFKERIYNNVAVISLL